MPQLVAQLPVLNESSCQFAFAPCLVACAPCLQLNEPDKHLRREYTPIHMRVGDEQKKRNLKLAQMRVLEVRILG
jgi:hypothetical protein